MRFFGTNKTSSQAYIFAGFHAFMEKKGFEWWITAMPSFGMPSQAEKPKPEEQVDLFIDNVQGRRNRCVRASWDAPIIWNPPKKFNKIRT